MQKIKVIELFAGYGSQHLALKRLKRDYPEFDFEVVAFCEIDKYAIKAYQALHGDKIPNLGDITKVNPVNVPDCDLMTWSFPCTDISSAGAQCGLAEGSNTRSSLCWDAMRIFEVKRPKYLLMENVSALVSRKFLGDFNKLQSDLQNLGYTNFFKLINAKDMGVPQNRLRIFMVSVLDCEKQYHFPKPFKLEKRLKDVLEQNVDERYYLKDERVQKLTTNIDGLEVEQHLLNGDSDGTSNTLTSVAKDNLLVEPAILTPVRTEYGKAVRKQYGDNNLPESRHNLTALQPKQDGTSNTLTSVSKDNLLIEPSVMQIGNIHKGESNPQSGRVYSAEGISPTVDCCQGGNREPKIIEDFYGTVRDPRVYTDEAPTLRADLTGLMVTKCTAPSVIELPVEKAHQQDAIQHENGITRCLVAGSHGNSAYYTNTAVTTPTGIRIRRLTERELYRLMDVEEKDIDTLLNSGIAKTQHAKLAGNSIVVNCLYHIFDRLLVHTEAQENEQLTLF